MADENTTKETPDARSFEERVLARLDMFETYFQNLDARIEKIEAKGYDTRPIWEQARAEIIEARKEIELINVRLDRIEGVAYSTRGSTRGEFVGMRADSREFRKHFKEPA